MHAPQTSLKLVGLNTWSMKQHLHGLWSNSNGKIKRKRHCCYSRGSTMFNKQNTDAFLFICSLLLLLICWMLFAYWADNPLILLPPWQEHRDVWLLPYMWQGSVVSAYHFWGLRADFCQPVGNTISGSRRYRDLSPSNPPCQEQSSKGRPLSMWSLVWPVKKYSRKWKHLIMELVSAVKCKVYTKHF